MASITPDELHRPSNDPNSLDVAPGVTLSQDERHGVAVIIDLFQGKGTMAKLKDVFDEHAVYEDEFAISGGIEQVGMFNPPTVVFLHNVLHGITWALHLLISNCSSQLPPNGLS